ncbi:unnamed protein product, partial [Mesorhabditis belari]|uniref:C-type lectin domain-containing protein n=1 Tax=Mesorhabditis belari TaxID=2138241 RepID=A0AAF3EH31_9BILA
MGFEQFELLPQSPSKTLPPKPYNIKSLLFGIFIGIFLGIIGTLLAEKSSNSTPSHSPLSRKARNLPVSQDEEKQAVDLLKICRANEEKLTLLIDSKSDCEVFKQNLTICVANNKALKEEKLTAVAEHNKAITLIERLETEKGTTEAQLVETKKKVVLLESEKNSNKNPSACPVPQSFQGKCRLGWTYLKETDSCYFYYEFTYNDEGQLNKYKWETAEEDCTRSGAHLASIHSNVEREFMKKMISSSFRRNNPKATPENGCHGTDFYVWFGLRRVDGKRTYSDGTPDDFVGTGELSTVTGNLYYSMCYESTNINQTYISYYSTEAQARRGKARYICQKPANK